MTIVDNYKDQIKTLCEKHYVASLFAFGSVLSNRFTSASDIDFLVEFRELNLYDYADNYFDFKSELEALLKRPVDLIEAKAVKNPYLKESIDSSKQLVYG